MKTTCTGASADQRVEGDKVDVASQTGPPTPNLGGDQGNVIAALSPSQDVGEFGPVISIEDDNISPDDAPEVMLEEDDGECKPNPMLPLGHPETAEEAIKKRYKQMDVELLQAMGTLGVGKEKGDEKTPPIKVDVKQRPQKKKRVKKNKKKDKSLIEESILRMRTSQSRTGSSRTHGQDIKAEGVTGYASPCSPPSTSKHRLEEARQGEEGLLEVPLLQQDAKRMSVSVIDETKTTSPPPERPTAFLTSRLALSATEGRLGHPDQHDLRSRRPAAPDFATTSGSPEQLAPICGAAPAAGEVEQTKKKRHLSNNILHTDVRWDQGDHSQVDWSESDRHIAETRLGGERASIMDLVDGPVHERTNEQGIFDLNENNGWDVDVDLSVSMVVDQSELQFEQFDTTFNPHLICQLSPYNEGIDDQQDDIVLEDSIPECTEDSAMEEPEAESWGVAGIAMAPRMVQLPSNPLNVSSSDYGSTSGALPWPSVETPAVVDTQAPIFEQPVLRELHASDSMTPQRLVFPQAVPLQDDASLLISDPIQSSASIGEIQSPRYQEPVGSLDSPITVLGAAVGQTASCSSYSPPFPSPPRDVSSQASPPDFLHLWDHQGEIEVVDWEIAPAQAINIDAGIQRDLRGSKRPNPIDLGGDAVQGQPQPSPKRSIASLPPLHSVPSIRTTLENCPAPAPPTLIERSEQGNDHASGKDQFEAPTRKSIPAIVQPPTPPPSPPSLPTPHAAIFKLRSPVHAGVVGFKRKFVDENDTSDHSINLVRRTPHFPRLKRRKIGHSTHKRLGEVMAMSRQEKEGTKLSEAIKFASRRQSLPLSTMSRVKERRGEIGGV